MTADKCFYCGKTIDDLAVLQSGNDLLSLCRTCLPKAMVTILKIREAAGLPCEGLFEFRDPEAAASA